MSAVSVDKLKTLVTKALEDDSYAEMLFTQPDKVATEFGLSADEKIVVQQMNREQFATARRDAAAKASGALSEQELEAVAGGATLSTSLSSPTLNTSTTLNMIVGRSILGVTGPTMPTLTNAACDCCPWKGACV